MMSFCLPPPQFHYSDGVSSSFLHPGPAGSRPALWVGGSCMRGTLWAACCGLFSPLNLCKFSVCSLHFSFFLPFPLSSCGRGKTYGEVYLFWFGVSSHMSLADFRTSMTVAWILRDYHVHVCPSSSSQWCHCSAASPEGQKMCMCVLCVWCSLAPLMLEQQSPWLPVHFLAAAL